MPWERTCTRSHSHQYFQSSYRARMKALRLFIVNSITNSSSRFAVFSSVLDAGCWYKQKTSSAIKAMIKVEICTWLTNYYRNSTLRSIDSNEMSQQRHRHKLNFAVNIVAYCKQFRFIHDTNEKLQSREHASFNALKRMYARSVRLLFSKCFGMFWIRWIL